MKPSNILAIPLALAACATTPPEPEDGIARAGLNERVYVDGPWVTPLKVLEDSRCPINVRCVWAGRVRLSVRIDLGSRSETREIAGGAPIQVADGQLAPGWTEGGTPVCTETGIQSAVVIAGDGKGGAFIAWLDGRVCGPCTRVYVQHVTEDGIPSSGWPTGGIAPVLDSAPNSVSIASDFAGGVLVAWLEESPSRAYAQRLTGAGVVAPGWPLDGLRISRPGDIDRKLKEARAHKEGPVLVVAEVVKEDNVFPMIPAGAAIANMIIEPPKHRLEKPSGST